MENQDSEDSIIEPNSSPGLFYYATSSIKKLFLSERSQSKNERLKSKYDGKSCNDDVLQNKNKSSKNLKVDGSANDNKNTSCNNRNENEIMTDNSMGLKNEEIFLCSNDVISDEVEGSSKSSSIYHSFSVEESKYESFNDSLDDDRSKLEDMDVSRFLSEKVRVNIRKHPSKQKVVSNICDSLEDIHSLVSSMERFSTSEEIESINILDTNRYDDSLFHNISAKQNEIFSSDNYCDEDSLAILEYERVFDDSLEENDVASLSHLDSLAQLKSSAGERDLDHSMSELSCNKKGLPIKVIFESFENNFIRKEKSRESLKQNSLSFSGSNLSRDSLEEMNKSSEVIPDVSDLKSKSSLDRIKTAGKCNSRHNSASFSETNMSKDSLEESHTSKRSLDLKVVDPVKRNLPVQPVIFSKTNISKDSLEESHTSKRSLDFKVVDPVKRNLPVQPVIFSKDNSCDVKEISPTHHQNSLPASSPPNSNLNRKSAAKKSETFSIGMDDYDKLRDTSVCLPLSKSKRKKSQKKGAKKNSSNSTKTDHCFIVPFYSLPDTQNDIAIGDKSMNKRKSAKYFTNTELQKLNSSSDSMLNSRVDNHEIERTVNSDSALNKCDTHISLKNEKSPLENSPMRSKKGSAKKLNMKLHIKLAINKNNEVKVVAVDSVNETGENNPSGIKASNQCSPMEMTDNRAKDIEQFACSEKQVPGCCSTNPWKRKSAEVGDPGLHVAAKQERLSQISQYSSDLQIKLSMHGVDLLQALDLHNTSNYSYEDVHVQSRDSIMPLNLCIRDKSFERWSKMSTTESKENLPVAGGFSKGTHLQPGAHVTKTRSGNGKKNKSPKKSKKASKSAVNSDNKKSGGKGSATKIPVRKVDNLVQSSQKTVNRELKFTPFKPVAGVQDGCLDKGSSKVAQKSHHFCMIRNSISRVPKSAAFLTSKKFPSVESPVAKYIGKGKIYSPLKTTHRYDGNLLFSDTIPGVPVASKSPTAKDSDRMKTISDKK